MTERLTDEQVALWVQRSAYEPDTAALAREVQDWRAFMLGGPCGARVHPCFDPACVEGRVPGLIEKLELIWPYISTGYGRQLQVIAASARRMVEP